MNKPKISIVVCTYNRAELLGACLQSLVEQSLDPSLFEVVVVDNHSLDNTLEIAHHYAKQYSFFRIVTELNQGHSHARNRGWREARGEYVAYIDDDAKATPDWCSRILSVFTTVMPTPAAVGGQIHPMYETPPPTWFIDDFEIRTWGERVGFLELPRARYGFSGSNMAFPRRVLERFDGFSSQYGIVDGKLRMGEDTEFFYRIYDEEPHFWYDPAILVYHWTPRHNCTLSYRFIRSYRIGEAAIHMQRRRLLSTKYARELICFFKLILSVPYRLLVAEGLVRTEAARLFQELGFKSGFLFGRCLGNNGNQASSHEMPWHGGKQ
ncbi:glycosyltransferase [Geomobilimonas luticola]|uniref:Glycosyltransferase family 2 protein n=1 Tax=Geomobilimonas luticola TaxID=1114878 RepID=A0ABS5SCD9_9BACT|nr:glycosyltransferase family 2 protein [Geomobilimonas luticola]MBT0653032.1 glycosyltransferase family 2 protein [Geomobilimonas luticola]